MRPRGGGLFRLLELVTEISGLLGAERVAQQRPDLVLLVSYVLAAGPDERGDQLLELQVVGIQLVEPVQDLQDQARLLGTALGPSMPSAVVASPLRRARETAQPVADCAGVEVATDQRLIDRDYGQWAGTSRESVGAQWGSVDDAPGVEPLPPVRDRAVRGLTDIAQRHRGGTVVVVSHDVVNRQVLVAFDPGLGDPDALPQDNGCFNMLELRGPDWAVQTVNELPT